MLINHSNCAVEPQVKQALTDLYYSTNGATWSNKNNWLNDDPCDASWYGVHCDETNGKILSVILPSNNLSGTLPESIGDLSDLLSLYLMINQIRGTLPNTIGDLVNLNQLYLSKNQLSGELPSSLAALVSLIDLDLSNNQLSGTVPSGINNLSSLSFINLQTNGLQGTIPTFSNTNLTSLSLQYNSFTGTIHNSYSTLQLSTLKLNNNQLTGTLPPFLQSPPDIRAINLANNQFDCPLPTWCSEEGTGQCEPCVNSLPISASPVPTPSLSHSESSSPTPSPSSDDSGDGGSVVVIVILVVFLVLCLGAILVVIAVAIAVMYKKKLGFFGKFEKIGAEDEDGRAMDTLSSDGFENLRRNSDNQTGGDTNNEGQNVQFDSDNNSLVDTDEI